MALFGLLEQLRRWSSQQLPLLMNEHTAKRLSCSHCQEAPQQHAAAAQSKKKKRKAAPSHTQSTIKQKGKQTGTQVQLRNMQAKRPTSKGTQQ
jgi:hypothetical protein